MNRTWSAKDYTVKSTGRKAGYEIYHTNGGSSVGGGTTDAGYFVLSHDGKTMTKGYVFGEKYKKPKIVQSPKFKTKSEAVKYAKGLGLPSLMTGQAAIKV